MAERRMFAKTITGSARFLMLPSSARLLYYDLGMAADDDGVVEAFVVLRLTCADRSDLDTLEKKGYIRVLNEELVTQILDWRKNNLIKTDRYQPSVYRDLIPENAEKTEQNTRGTQVEPIWNPSGTELEPQDRIGKDRLGKDSIGEGRGNGTQPAPLPESEKEILVSEGISESYIDTRVHRASDYARAHERGSGSVLREWWANDKNKYTEPTESSFDTDDFFAAAVRHSMKKISMCDSG